MKLEKLQYDFDEARTAKDKSFVYRGVKKTQTEQTPYTTNKLLAYEKWYLGHQWDVYPSGEKMDTSNDIATPTINFIRTIIDQKVALLKKMKVNFDVRPVEMMDIDGAKLVSDVLNFIWYKSHLQLKIGLWYKDSLIYGNGFLKMRLNSDGKIEFININPVNIYPDKIGDDIPDMRYITITYERSPEYIEYIYNKKVEPDENDRVIVYETWYNPSVNYPHGALVIWTDQTILKEIDDLRKISKYKPEIPIFVLKHNPLSTGFWGQSEVAHLAQIQMVHNKSMGFVLDNLLLTNNCQFQTTDDNIPDVVSNEPGHVYKVQQIGELQPIQTPQLSPQWFSLIQYTGYGTFQQESGTYAVNLGGAATRTASGILALQNAGGTLTQSDFIDIQHKASEIAQFIFAYVRQYYKNDEVLQMTDVAKPLKEVSPYYDIFIKLGDALPDDKIARLNMAMQLLQSGAIKQSWLAEYFDDPILLKHIDEIKKEEEEQKQMVMQAQSQAQQPQTNQEANNGEG